MGVVVLQKSVASDVEDFDFLIIGAGGDTSAVRVELDAINHASVVGELVDLLAGRHIPDSYSPIVATGGYHTRVCGKLRGLRPILVTAKSLQEALAFSSHGVSDAPHLN